MKMMRKGGSGKHAYGSMGNDAILPPGHPRRPAHDMRGPKKYKWKRDVLSKMRVNG